MVEVFRTNVTDERCAAMILQSLHESCALYVANFDLEDRDHVLRIKCLVGDVDTQAVVCLLEQYGFQGEVLPDDVPLFHIDAVQ